AGFTKNAVVADCHTHDETGLISENGNIKIAMTDKLLKKKKLIESEISLPYISNDKLEDNIVVGWGSTFGVINDAVQILTGKGFLVTHVHFHEVYPLPCDFINQSLKNRKKILCVENNATGQFANLLKLEANISVDDNILKYDGRPFYLDEIVSELESRLKK
ncbi:MAG: 2-oxoacid:acceptor oxidoreductase subunit alpha, partial [Candidatus Anammoxibacter sp.]